MNPLLLNIPETLQSQRLLLRVPHAGDGEMMNASISESMDELKLWLPWARETPSRDESETVARQMHAQFISREALTYHIFLRDSNDHIGLVDLHAINWDVPKFEIGYWLRTTYSGRGYMSEAVDTISALAFTRLNARRVQIVVDDRNEKSARVAERVGYELECVRRHDSRDSEGNLCDARIYVKTA